LLWIEIDIDLCVRSTVAGIALISRYDKSKRRNDGCNAHT
jgi:hypothetical protein